MIYLSDKYNTTIENSIAKKIFDMSGIQTRQLTLKNDIIQDLHTHLEKTLRDV